MEVGEVAAYSDIGEIEVAGHGRKEGSMRNRGAEDWSICAGLAVAVEAAGT